MNELIYKKNMEALRGKYPVWAAILENVKRKKRNFDVIAEESLMENTTILKVVQDGKTLYLNGKYAPSAVIERWFQNQGKIDEYAPVVILGVSNGEHIRQIMERAPKTSNILIYEPSFEVFRRAMQEVDLSFIFQPDIPVGIIVEGINEEEIESYFRLFISYDNMTLLRYYISGNYHDLFQEKTEKFITNLKKYVYDIHVAWNTRVRYANVRAVNVFVNLHYLYEGYSVRALYGMLPKEVPVIIVSAGPSLNKNIMDLKKAVGKACIIATDTAVKPLLNAGIIPDLFVIIDGLKPDILFQHKDISRVPMVAMTAVSTGPMTYHKGKKFFYGADSALEDYLTGDIKKKESEQSTRVIPYLVTGGSVATSAYALGLNMGTGTVILVGQDLAMTGNRTHADGTFQDEMDQIDADSGEYFEVESVDGGKVLTRLDFDLYRRWFEDHFEKWDHVTVVDATEGGALIRGTKIMTLKKAIQKYCVREFNVKWHIDRCKKLFVGDDREKVLNCFGGSLKKLEEVKKKAKEGLGYYERLEKLSRKKNVSDQELAKVLKKISKVNRYMESDYMARTVMDSLEGLNYTLRPIAYQMQADKAGELMDVAEQGKVLLYGVTVAADEISDIAEQTIVKYAEEHPVKDNERQEGNKNGT
ncbi:6-hydroxymethylpterin diphosphokinase MptE-like protein [Lachnospiraceae bacterium KK002]